MARGRVLKRRWYISPSYSSSDGEEYVTGDVPSKHWKQMSDDEKEPCEAACSKEWEMFRQHGTGTLKKKAVKYRFHRSAPSKFIEVISKFDEKKRRAVQEIGFGNLLELKCSYFNRDLCLNLIAQFDCSSCRLRVGDEKFIPISTLDIESILGIPRTQLPVPTSIPSGASWIKDGGFRQKNGLQVSTLADKLLKLDAGDEFKRTFVLFTCGAILSPNACYSANSTLLKAVDRVEQISTYNWCLYVLNFLVKSIQTFSDGAKRCTGCLIFLQFLYLMRVDVKCPSPKEDVLSIGVWTDMVIKARIRFEKEELGGFGRCQYSFNGIYSPIPFHATRRANVDLEMDILSPATRVIPISEKITSELAPETQVSTSPAASLIYPGQLEKTNSTGSPRLTKGRKASDVINNSISESDTSNDEVELENLISKVIAPQTEKDEEIEPAAALSASNKAVFDNPRPIRRANEASNIVGSRPEGSANIGNQREEHPGQTFSRNPSGMAEMLDDNSSDLNEVGSSLYPALVTVNGYRVKPEWVPLLKAICLKHGDIAKNCSLLSVTSRSSLLEIVCDIVQKSQDTEFRRITHVDLESMLDQVRDLETVNMEVGWLHQWLDKIFDAMPLFKGYSTLKKEILALQQKILTLKENVLLAENQLAPMKAEAEKIDEKVSETNAKLKCFYQKSVVDGLV
ncbi:uncharacterized protein LOC132266650 [Cornus florida]|uniref:uncharacterized protein LOC132266650 n=1 Tax=Cornus florida TaxID=4283 RepID=UPI0028A2A697|nr:uncharacterized protein LOC132266650 [Cornus florida]